MGLGVPIGANASYWVGLPRKVLTRAFSSSELNALFNAGILFLEGYARPRAVAMFRRASGKAAAAARVAAFAMTGFGREASASTVSK